MKERNYIKLEFPGKSSNEAFARAAAAAFAAQLDPTMEELGDIKTAVSEAVTNAIVQAMKPLYTTGGEERSGMGFTIMGSFMDTLRVRSRPGKGTTVVMRRRIWRRKGTQ